MSSSALEIQQARASSVTVTEDTLTLDLEDGRTISVPLVWYPRLWHGTQAERNSFEIFGNGAYIHWPELDEDVMVAGLLAGQPSGENPSSLQKWLESRESGDRVADGADSSKSD